MAARGRPGQGRGPKRSRGSAQAQSDRPGGLRTPGAVLVECLSFGHPFHVGDVHNDNVPKLEFRSAIGTGRSHGTGSDDFYNGGWYNVPGRCESRLSFTLSGCLDYKNHLGRTGGYRIFLGDAYSYRESILQTIVMMSNKIDASYTLTNINLF